MNNLTELIKMINKKISLFVIAMMILLLGISIVSANDTSVEDSIETASDLDVSTPVDKYTSEVKSNEDNAAVTKNIKKEAKTVVITNETYDTYFTDNTLNDMVSEGDTLDIQGNMIGSQYKMIINTPVNIISSTQDSYIDLNTSSTSYFGDEDVVSFTLKNGASNSNITGIYFHNTQIFLKNTHNVTINNITVVAEDRQLGSGVGVTSIRDNSSNIIVENSTFSTKNNQGSSSLVLAWASNCTINNNKVTAIGNVGNLIYLTTYNVDGVNESESINDYNTITNNVLTGPSTVTSICWGIVICGRNNYIANNSITYNGTGITGQWTSGGEDQSINSTIVGNNLVGCALNCPTSGIVANNTITGKNGQLMINDGCLIENNTAASLKLSSSLETYNIVNGNVTVPVQTKNISIANLEVNGNIVFTQSSSSYDIPSNITIKNNTINGDIILKSSKDSNIINNTVNGQINVTGKNGFNKNLTIEGNNVTTDEEYAILIEKRSDNVTIVNNTLKAHNSGDSSVYSAYESSTIEVSDNGDGTVIEDKVYLTIAEFEAVAGQKVNLTANVKFGRDSITGGKVVFKINGKTVKDENNKILYAKVVDGVATLEYTIADSWADKELNITAVYSGYKNYSSQRSDIYTVNVAGSEVSLEINGVAGNIAANSTLNIEVDVKVGESAVDTGKVILKIDGKIIKDDNGKCLYFNVVDGKVNYDYNIGNLKASKHVLTAVYIAGGQRVESQTTFDVVKA